MTSYLNNKKVLFVTTKNLDYIRNTQEIGMLENHALSYSIIGLNSNSYPLRMMYVFLKLLMTRMSQYDTVFIGFAPQLVVPLFKWKLRKSDIVIDFFISMYDTLCCDRKRIKKGSILAKILHWLDEITLRNADAVICDTNAHGKYFHDEFGMELNKLSTIYLQADASIYYPRNIERFKHLKDKYVVLYFGSVLPLQGIDIVLKTMRILKNQNHLRFIFIGPIKGKELEALRPISENIEYIDWVQQEKLAEYIDMADLCLAGHFCKSIEKAYRTIPGKAYIYQAMNKPMILGDNPANHELFEEDDMVTFVEMGNEQALADAIMEWSRRK